VRSTPPAASPWRKSSHSNAEGHRVEVAVWRKSTHSNAMGNCVEAGNGPGVVAVRDSKNPDGPVLAFTPDAWRSFLDAVRSGAV